VVTARQQVRNIWIDAARYRSQPFDSTRDNPPCNLDDTCRERERPGLCPPFVVRQAGPGRRTKVALKPH